MDLGLTGAVRQPATSGGLLVAVVGSSADPRPATRRMAPGPWHEPRSSPTGCARARNSIHHGKSSIIPEVILSQTLDYRFEIPPRWINLQTMTPT
jgi:hypothetical protein